MDRQMKEIVFGTETPVAMVCDNCWEKWLIDANPVIDVCYCPHNATVAGFDGKKWVLFRPFTLEQFMDMQGISIVSHLEDTDAILQ